MNAIDPYEQVVEVTVEMTPTGEHISAEHISAVTKETLKVKRFVISDTHPYLSRQAHYRTDNPLKAFNAWTRSANYARWHLTREAAQDALWSLRGDRMLQDPIYDGKHHTIGKSRRHVCTV